MAAFSAPLSESGNFRGRLVAGWQDNNSFIERYGVKKQFIYGVVDADLTDSATLGMKEITQGALIRKLCTYFSGKPDKEGLV